MIYRVVILLLCFSTVCVEAWKKAKYDPQKPDYIPDNYLQIEEGDFKTYLEWWDITYDRTRDISRSEYNGHYTPVELYLNTKWNIAKFDQVYPIYNETRYVLMKSSIQVGNGEENYGLAIANENFLVSNYITMKSHLTEPSLNQHSFLCRHWLILSPTKALDTLGLYTKQTVKQYTVLEKSLVEDIDSIEGEDCFRSSIVNNLHKCFKKFHYCTMDYSGIQPKLVISNERVIESYKGAEIIMRFFNISNNFVNAAYYVLKHAG